MKSALGIAGNRILCRAGKVVSRSERVAQVVVSVKVVRSGLDRRAKIGNRSLTLPIFKVLGKPFDVTELINDVRHCADDAAA